MRRAVTSSQESIASPGAGATRSGSLRLGAVLRRNWQQAAQWLPAIDDTRRSIERARWHRAVTLAKEWGEP
jgi:hypothetical protein